MMDPATKERLFGFRSAFDHPVTLWITVAAAGGIVLAFVVIAVLKATGRVGPELHRELVKRTRSWAILAPLLIIPVLLGGFWTMLGAAALSLLCYQEFARATGLFRHRLLSAIVVLGILALFFATLDHWYGFFTALTPLTVILLAAVAITADQPKGYIQRVALGVFGFLFFGTCLGHLGFMGNDADYRPIVLVLLLTVEMNDVFAYCTGKLFGRRKLAPQTSPNKTIGGALGAVILTGSLVAVAGHFVFLGGPMDRPLLLAGLGLIISVAGQLGDLMLSSIKRDLGIKDMGSLIPGHGGILDRFDSLILVAPAVFHYVRYHHGIGQGQVERIITGG